MAKYKTISVKPELYNGLELEALKQGRPVANLVEWIFVKQGIQRLTEKELEQRLKKIEVAT